MPMRWTILHAERLVLARAEGVMRVADVEEYLDAVFLSGALGYAKLVDLTPAVDFELSDSDFMNLAGRTIVRLSADRPRLAFLREVRVQFNKEIAKLSEASLTRAS